MSTFAIVLLCAQAFLIQKAYSQCLRGPIGPIGPLGFEGGLGPYGYEGLLAPAYGLDGIGCGGLGPYGYDGLIAPAYGYGYPTGITAIPTLAAYGGEGIGDVAVAGEMGVGGVTEVVGQVPILGAVEFGGIVPAAGTITITGTCGCGCRGGYYY